MNTFLKIEPAKRNSLLILFTSGLFFWISITSFLVTLPAYIKEMGATPQQVGLVMGYFVIGLLISRIWLGNIADRHSRKLVILIGAFVVASAPIGYIFANSLPGMMAVRAFHGISIGAFTTGYSALVVDLSPPKQKGELIGYMGLVVPIGMAIGPALSGFLQQAISYSILFLISTFLGFVALLLASQVQEVKKNNTYLNQENDISSDHHLSSKQSFWTLVTSKSLIIPAIILTLVGCTFGALTNFIPLFIQELNTEIGLEFNPGLFFTAAAISSFTIRVFVGRASDYYGRGLFITISIICYIISMQLLTVANTSSLLLISGSIEGAAGGMIIPMMLALISDRCYAEERGKVFAFCLSGFDIGIAVGGAIIGYISLDHGYESLFAFAGKISIVALIIFLLTSNKKITNSLGFAVGKSKDLYAVDP